MRRHLVNAAYGVLDYVSYPLGMLLVAPIVLHKLGAAEYGLWAISTAVVSVGGILASGFCDANIQRVARLRGSSESATLVHTVRSMLGINLSLGIIIGAVVWIASPLAARHIEAAHMEQMQACLICLRIASVLIVVRALESVGVSTQRAFERFGFSVRVNAAVRLLTLGSAALLALNDWHTVSILMETAVFLSAGAVLQIMHARTLLGRAALWPVVEAGETRQLLGTGIFPWIQASGGVIFSQLDRLLLGVSLGAAAVAPYALCVQFAHPIFGLTASALQFLFPYLSGRVGVLSTQDLRRVLLKVFLCNAALVACGACGLLLFGERLIRLWAGAAVARSAASLLPPVVLGSALMGLTVTGTYALLALGLFRTVAWISLSARGLMLLLMAILIRYDGAAGLAGVRVLYGLLSLMLYLPLLHRLRTSGRGAKASSFSASVAEFQEAPEL